MAYLGLVVGDGELGEGEQEVEVLEYHAVEIDEQNCC